MRAPLPNPFVLGDPAYGGFIGGVRKGISNNDLRPCDAQDGYNYIGSDKGLESRDGSLRVNQEELQQGVPITGLFRFFDGEKFRIFAKCGANVYDVQVSGTSPTIATGLDPSVDIQFARWFGRYFFVDGKNLWAGTTGAASKVTLLDQDGNPLANPPKGHSILIKDQRIYLAYDPDHNTYVYFSETDFYDRFKATNWVACDRDDGRPVYGMEKHANKIFSFKENQIYVIMGDYSLGNLAVVEGPKVGAWSQKAILDCPDGYLRWVGPDGVWEYNDAEGHRRIDWNIWNDLKKVDPAMTQNICLGWYSPFLVLAFSEPGAPFNNLVTLYDTRTEAWWPVREWYISTMHTATTGELYAGWSNAGFVKQLFVGEHDDGQEIACMWKSKRFGVPGIEHCLDYIRTSLQRGQSVTISWESDPSHGQAGSRTFTADDVGTYLGDENNPRDDDFLLGDEDIPGDGDILVSEEELGQGAEDFNTRMRGGITFNEMSFTIEQRGFEKMSLDWVELDIYPTRIR